MLCLWLPGGSCMAALTVALVLLSPLVALVRDTQMSFLHQKKFECHYLNGTEQVRYLERHIYNQEDFLLFDSDTGKYCAVTELGLAQAKYWNSKKDFLKDVQAAVDTFCRFNYRILEKFIVHKTGQPKVTVYPTKTQPLPHHNLLVCSVSDFYPGHVQVRWFRNGQEEVAGVVSTGLIQNGDWTFQTLVMLETVPQSGEVYACQVEHLSSSSPVTVEWRAQSGSSQTKMLSGVGGFVLGLLFLGAGLLICCRNQKERGSPGTQDNTTRGLQQDFLSSRATLGSPVSQAAGPSLHALLASVLSVLLLGASALSL